MVILGIETSCDETAAAVVRGGGKIEILSGAISSQIEIHKKYGGIVPEVAAREHVLNILPVIEEALARAGIEREAAGKKLSAIAVTTGPGLITSLQVGVETAKSLSLVWGVPLAAVNHIEGHLCANFIGGRRADYPAVALTVSGGHTMLILMKGQGKYETIGETRDDAAGEAFDKAAKLMELGYPGGPAIAAAADNAGGTEAVFPLPRPMMHSGNFDFSFSGLKTALLYALKNDPDWRGRVPAYAREFEQAVVETLVKKTARAAKEYGAKTVMLTGGVSANRELRRRMEEAVRGMPGKTRLSVPDLSLTTDNAAMIAAAGYYHAARNQFTPLDKLRAEPNMKLESNK